MNGAVLALAFPELDALNVSYNCYYLPLPDFWIVSLMYNNQ